MPSTVVTDTTHYLPAEVIERHGIELVSLYVNWDGRTDREIDLPDYDGFYDFLLSGGALPSTSQPSLGDFLAVYEPLIERLVERGREIYGCEPDLLSEVGPVIGTHIGPGMLGVAGLRRELLGPM